MYAVIALQWHQYIVQKGDVITVDKIEATDGKTKVTVDTVLAVYDADGKNVTLGTPYIAKASVVADIEWASRGKKVVTVKMKIKNRYHRRRGFKAHQSILKIKDIVLNG